MRSCASRPARAAPPRPGRAQWRPCASAAVAAPPAPADAALLDWLARAGAPPPLVTPGPGGLVCPRGAAAGTVLALVPGSLCVSAADAAHPLAPGRGEVVSLALWLLGERERQRDGGGGGDASDWAPLLDSLPDPSRSPLRWPPALVDRLLRGSTVAAAAAERAAAVEAEWAALSALGLAYPLPEFADAMATVLAAAVPLPSLDSCLALLPLVGLCARRSPGPSGSSADIVNARIDYDATAAGGGAVVLTASRAVPPGGRVVACDPALRGSGELLLACGDLEAPSPGGPPFPGDNVPWTAALVAADRLYAAKAAVLADAGLSPDGHTFPVPADALPSALLAYLRLSRLTDVAQLPAVRFDADAPVSALNEYEVLQLMLADVRDRLAAYPGGTDADEAVLAGGEEGGGREARLAASARLAEQAVLRGTAAGLRRRLAPIRGKPTKGGRMEAPNADITEIFEQLEGWRDAPRNALNNLLGWDEDGKPPKSGCSA